MQESFGKIHSIETCGTVDGPGIRFVIFMQGCPMRCLYCHNPDTWDLTNSNMKLSVENILNQYNSVKEFCKGGITVSGGEPLTQIDFVTELFQKCKEKNINTALDTSGITFDRSNILKFDNLLGNTDVVLLDIKHINEAEHKKLTGHSNKNILDFAKYLSYINKSVWIRHVVVPGINNSEAYLNELGKFLGTLNNIKALDVLPYHNMAIPKYENLGIKYKLSNTPPLSKEEAIKARNIIIDAYKLTKKGY